MNNRNNFHSEEKTCLKGKTIIVLILQKNAPLNNKITHFCEVSEFLIT